MIKVLQLTPPEYNFVLRSFRGELEGGGQGEERHSCVKIGSWQGKRKDQKNQEDQKD